MLCCSSVSGVGVVVVAFEAVGCCISAGDVGVRIFCCLVGGGVLSNGLTNFWFSPYCSLKLHKLPTLCYDGLYSSNVFQFQHQFLIIGITKK